MSLYTDSYYINLLSPKLRNFRRKDKNTWNFSCPLCGDSKKDLKKARGYIFQKKGGLFFKCHNCQQGLNMANLIKAVDPILYDQYVMERFKNGNVRDIRKSDIETVVDYKAPVFKKVHEVLQGMQRVSSLDCDHPCRVYVAKRKIPEAYWRDLWWCEDFKTIAMRLSNDKERYKKLPENDARLVITFLNESGELMGIQGRTIDPNNDLRYITLKVDDNVPKIYGLDKVDRTKPVYVVEGPIDSMFIPNCVAMACSALDTVSEFVPKKQCILIPDREPRNREIVNQIKGFVDDGWKVCLMPDSLKSKDINDYILKDGLTQDELLETIEQNSSVGLSLKLKFADWKKV